MKKLYVIFLSVFLSVLTFSVFYLNSFADGFDFPTAGVTISIHERYNRGDGYKDCYDFELESIYPIVFYKASVDGRCYCVSPMAYGRSRLRGGLYSENDNPSDLGNWYSWSTISWSSSTLTLDGVQKTVYTGNVGFNMNGATYSNVIIFNSLANAIRYFDDPENPDNADNLADGVGEDIIIDSTTPSVNWGDNGLPYMEGSTPSESIPAPRFTVSGGQSGNIAKTIQFYNFEYDSRAQDGRYGLVMTMKWGSIDGFQLNHTGGMFADTFNVTYSSTLPWGDYIFVYDVPEKENQINYCPQSFSFDTNTACVNGFNSYLTNYPINSRTVQGPTEFNSLTGVGPIESFKDYLSKPSCPYNTLIFSCYYYRKMPDGHFEFGPSSTGTFYPPSQNAIYNMNSKTSNDKGSMNTGYGGGMSGEGDDPYKSGNNWHHQWGDNTPNIDYGQNVDPQALVNNISDLFGLIGQMPSFMGQLFVFLPTWLINFISVCVALAIAIGVVKLFIG